MDREGLGDVGTLGDARARFDRHLVLPRVALFRIAPRLAGAHIVVPAVPGTTQDFALAQDRVIARPVRDHQPADPAPAQRRAGMGTAIEQRVIIALHIEDADFPPAHRDQLVAAGRNFIGGGNDVMAHPQLLLSAAERVSGMISQANTADASAVTPSPSRVSGSPIWSASTPATVVLTVAPMPMAKPTKPSAKL